MKNQRVTYSGLNLSKDPKMQQRKFKGRKIFISVTEQEITQVELNLENAPLDHQGNDNSCYCKFSLLSPEKLVAEILAIVCIVLVGSVLKMVSIALVPFTIMEKQNNSFQNVKTHEDRIAEIARGKHNCAMLHSLRLQSDGCGSSKRYYCKHKL
ncbi:PREDICTED: NKG2-F type II integral membrane protein [Propithecus coquereli]|uniref:NKG2-F type II integral membrane protein n=1 Tax=Propithecus coquereli TaxID=379532 RepID=UPI00063F4AF1|nr:PREDICTED: NKG2-F type II integral membrane protein [Propithecus coquereli]